MPLDPEVQALIDERAGEPDTPELTVAQNRERYRDRARRRGLGADVAGMEEMTAPGPQGPVALRLYRPGGISATAGRLPLLVWFHGGGWVVGDLVTSDAAARELCAGAGVVVANVDYPLAPENRFPVAPEACFAVTAWLADHADDLGVDATRLAIGGDSAGGNLAAVTTLRARDEDGPPIAFQLLVYPVTDLLLSFPSIRDNAEGYMFTAAAMQWYADQYLGQDGDPNDPNASPIYAERVDHLPPALVITAEYDPLRDEGEAYAKRLEQAGVPVTVSRYDGQVHGFFVMTALLDGARRAMAEVCAALRVALA